MSPYVSQKLPYDTLLVANDLNIYKSSLPTALYCWIFAPLSLPSFLKMQASRYAVWSTLVLNVTCWVSHSRFHTPFQYISTILLCRPGGNHDSLNYSLHSLVSAVGRIKQTLLSSWQKNGVSTVTSKSFTSFWLLAPWSKMTDFTHNPMSNARSGCLDRLLWQLNAAQYWTWQDIFDYRAADAKFDRD